MSSSPSESSETHALKCEMAAEILQSAGFLRLRVNGWSMLPSIWPGDVLAIARTAVKDVAKGDLVLSRRDRRLVVHRVIEMLLEDGATRVVTRGDAMPGPDQPIRAHDVLGKVIQIARCSRWITPGRQLRISQRAVAALVRRSDLAARILVKLHEITRPMPWSSFPNPNPRAESCQS